ncbi:MAG: ABC transporter permease [Bdellovibrionales bacterium]
MLAKSTSQSSFKIFWIHALAATEASLLLRYRQSFSGFLWVILNPVIMFSAQSLVFHYILRIDVENYFIFLLSGLLPWLFVVQSLEMNSTVIINNSRVTKAYPINPLAFVVAQLIDNLINFLVALLTLIAVLLFWGKPISPYSIFLFIPLIPLAVGTLSLSIIISVGNVFLRDLKFVVSFVLSVSFYLTPIFYPENFLPPALSWLPKLNFLYLMIKPIRSFLYGETNGSMLFDLSLSLGTTCVLVLVATWVWQKHRNAVHLYV